ncbi:MAG: anaerobic ribonucleoside-triphosphate reductase activating protein [Candidatus Thorarchaeota archaeon]|nr:MAG: anaerobic ribonucleoside-triphosphate reductase activating protein [Candidatus Thorarchaeota archaeon]
MTSRYARGRHGTMRLASVIDISLVDVPGIPVTVIFTGGCNFNCPYCQNSELISSESGTELTVEEVAEKARGHLTDGYCITGGEPTIHKDLPDLLRLLRVDGECHINLNTQGSVPSVLERCLPYLDSVWFDIKTTPDRYPNITRTGGNPWAKVLQSARLVMASDVAFWPRTTYAGDLMTSDEILGVIQILEEIGFLGEYVVQNYVHSSGVREDEAVNLRIPEKEDLNAVFDLLPDGIILRLEWR